ncbi:hypothetical protein PTKIN_Ptkin01aG0244700 [Pterospermum kingtungense]
MGTKKNKIVKLKIVVEKLQKSLLLTNKRSLDFKGWEQDHKSSSVIKGGHFAVFAVENEKTKRFVVPLSYLNHLVFLRLLEEATEEFGFFQREALCVPCQWSEMERLLTENAF